MITSKKLIVDGVRWPLTDEGTPIIYSDFVTEAYYRAGLVHLSFAVGIKDGDNPSEAKVTVRLKMPVRLAFNVSEAITSILRDAKKHTRRDRASQDGAGKAGGEGH